jgi:N6-L-threonylcarbamoyladenine synthase
MILDVKAIDNISIVAKSNDDSFGESFDKVAKMLKLGYPGGPIVEKLAKDGDEDSYKFPIPLSKSPRLEFSYSGLKNAVRLAINNSNDILQDQSNICASFQKAAIQHIIQKTRKYFKTSIPKNVALVGGASANNYLRKKIKNLCDEFDIKLYLADLQYTSDNAAMIARAGIEFYKLNRFVELDKLDVNSKTILHSI